MEDESSVRVNVTAHNMPGYIGRDVESVHVSSGTRSTDFGREVLSSEAKVPSSLSLSSKDVLEFHKHKHEPGGNNNKENDERENIRAVDILRRNFGSTSIRDPEDPKDLEKVGLNDLDHERMQCSTKSLQQSMDSNSGLGDPDGNHQIDHIDLKSGEDPSQSKEHVYCTVYCIANDNYRIPVEKTSSDHETTSLSSSSSSSDVLVLPPTDLPNSELDYEHYPAPYTVTDLMLSGINSYYNADNSLSVVLTCRICLDDKKTLPLHCCKNAVCEECLKRYIISQVAASIDTISMQGFPFFSALNKILFAGMFLCLCLQPPLKWTDANLICLYMPAMRIAS